LSPLLLLVGCSLWTPEPIVVTKTKIKTIQIDVKEHPTPLVLKDVSWYVVTEENLEEFKNRFKKETNDELVFYAMSVSDYERMAINFADITRYIKQQKELLVYYEKAILEQSKTKQGD
jgi:leucyl aminopeptidase (aminopeptidase T)